MKLLYSTDGGVPAMHALGLLERVADPEKTHVTVVAVPGTMVGERIDAGDNSGPDILTSTVKQLTDAGFAVEGHLLEGWPAPAILAEIDRGEFEMTVLGAGNRSWLGRLLLGSVSTKVLHASPTSVLIVRQISEIAGRARILFATDGSGYADRAQEQMVDFLDPSSCVIHVLSVAEHLMVHASFPIPRVGYAASGPTPEKEREWIEAAQQIASDAATKLQGAGFRTETHAALGGSASKVLSEAQRLEADLVVVGSRGLGAVNRAVLGSVSDQIVREAPATLLGRNRES